MARFDIAVYKFFIIYYNKFGDNMYSVETDGDGFEFENLEEAMAFIDTIVPTEFYGNY